MTRRPLCLAGLLCLLLSCDRVDPDHAPAGETSPITGDTAATAFSRAEPRIPAFTGDSAPVADSGASADTAGSVYTSLAEAACRLVEEDAETGGTTSRCPGAGGYTLLLHDFDARMTVDVVAPGGRTLPLRYSGVVTSAFSSLGPRAEWRMRNGAPFALVVRVNAYEHPETPDRATSYLAVAKVAPGAACVTDRVPPTTPNANQAARQAADRSASTPCMPDLAAQ